MVLMSELCDLIDRHGTDDFSPSAVPGLHLFRSEVAGGTVPMMYQPLLAIVAQGTKKVILGEEIFTYGTGSYLLASVDLPVQSSVLHVGPRNPFLAIGLAIDLELLASLVLEMPPVNDGRDAGPSLGISVQPITPDLLDAVVRLVRLLDRPDELKILAPLAEREILFRLLQSPKGGIVRQLAQEKSGLSQISKVVQWIRSNYARAFSIKDLTRIANMSETSLHRHFKVVTSMTPLQFQKLVRLQEARRFLFENVSDAASVGFAVGYGSSTQFSREYARQFGAPPARDAARLRASRSADDAESPDVPQIVAIQPAGIKPVAVAEGHGTVSETPETRHQHYGWPAQKV